MTPEQREAFGIEHALRVTGRDDLTGIGVVHWYRDHETAVDADEASAAVRTADVARGVVGPVAWDYAGEAAAADLIEDCLG